MTSTQGTGGGVMALSISTLAMIGLQGKLEAFEGRNITAFLNRFESLILPYNLSDENQLRQLYGFIHHEYLDTVRDIVGSSTDTYSVARPKLLEGFKSMDGCLKTKEMTKYDGTSPIQDHLIRFEQEVKQHIRFATLTDADKVGLLCKTMKGNQQLEKALRKIPDPLKVTLKEVKKELLKLVLKRQEIRHYFSDGSDDEEDVYLTRTHKGKTSGKFEGTSDPSEIEDLSARLEALTLRLNRHEKGQRQQQRQQDSSSYNRRDQRCYFCGEKGHVRRDGCSRTSLETTNTNGTGVFSPEFSDDPTLNGRPSS